MYDLSVFTLLQIKGFSHVCMHVCMYVCMYVCICSLCKYLIMNTHDYLYVCVCMYAYTIMHTHNLVKVYA